MKNFNYGIDHLTIGICLDIASGKIKGIINDVAAARINASWKEVEK
jgi:histidine ammonia-lyase